VGLGLRGNKEKEDREERERTVVKMREALSYDDVLLVPQYSEVISRKTVSLESELDNNISLSLPIISSPMDTVSEDEMAFSLGMAGGLSILHRYCTIEAQCKMIKKVKQRDPTCLIGAAIGVTDDFEKRANALVFCGADLLCIDVAHGDHTLVKSAIHQLRAQLGDKLHIMAGNVATAEGFMRLEEWGANSVRLGIGSGAICTSRIVAGHGVPVFQTILDCAMVQNNAKIIADGGIRGSGDVIKAFGAGADFVMCGSLLAGTDEAPGGIVTVKDKKYKPYRGMASFSSQMEWREKSSTPEGVSTLVPYKGSVTDVLRDLIGGIKSGFSYSGASNLKELQRKARFIKQTHAGIIESSAHIFHNGGIS